MTQPGTCSDELSRHALRVAALRRPECFPHPVAGPVRLIETHISSVLLTGEYAYKLKKPVDLGFLDFSTLAARRHFCDEELRLNRRLAPDVYGCTVAVCGTDAAPYIAPVRPGAAEGVLDYAVQMREFPQAALLDGVAARGALTPAMIDALAACVAAFHARVPACSEDDRFGTPDAVRAPVDAVLAGLRAQAATPGLQAQVARLAAWCAGASGELAPVWAARRRQGFVREGHGDLHLGNIAWLHGAPQIFDCIEFSAALRWGDVMSDVAFLVMDLEAHGQAELACRFLNAWLAHTGDYEGVTVLRYYRVYRALVRALVAGIRAGQREGAAAAEPRAMRQRLLDLAEATATFRTPRLLVMHGLSGSGKSWASAQLAERLGAVRVRSDLERKRLALQAHAADAFRQGLYAAPATAATYARLAALAGDMLAAGQSVIIDAANLQRAQRDLFCTLAQRHRAAVRIVSCHAAEATLLARLAQRRADGGDPSDADAAVLHAQQSTEHALNADERPDALVIDEAPGALDAVLAALQPQALPA